MLQSIYVALTGLTAYSKDLTTIGDNVANINTPGFKANNTLFENLFYQTSLSDSSGGAPLQVGTGIGIRGTQRTFSEGQLRTTGNDQDVAINGNGFFVVQHNGQTVYTRAGQFSFDSSGNLVVTGTTDRVQGLGAGANLHDINVSGLRTSPGKATATVSLTGTLNTGGSAGTPFTLSNVSVIDSAGTTHTYSVVFTNNTSVTAGSWLVTVNDDKNAKIAGGEVRFGTDGTPAPGFNTLTFNVTPANSKPTTVTLSMGDPGSAAGVRAQANAADAVSVSSQDGFAVGSVTRETFDATGTLVITYSNGQTAKGDQLALADFQDLQSLQAIQGNLFQPPPGVSPVLGHAGTGTLGSVAADEIEISNVDLAQEFGDLIISQRGYQGSSQVISTANDMMQQLFDIKGKR